MIPLSHLSHLSARSSLSARLILAALLLALGAYGVNGREYGGVVGLSADELSASIWNFCGRGSVDVRVARAERIADVYRENIAETTDFFVVRGDSVLWTGYNVGRRMGMVADSPVPVRVKTLAENIVSPYTASGTLDVSVKLKETGRIECSHLASGRAVIAPGDTLSGVSLTRTVHTRIVSASDTARSDTVRAVTFRWTMANAQVPIAIQRDDILYIVDNQEFTTDVAENGEETPNADLIRDLLNSPEAELSNGQLRIAFAGTVAVHIYVMDATGNIYRSAQGRAEEYIIDISGLPHNTYIISIVSDDLPEITHKLITRI